MNKFPRLWYESNACWGWVESIDHLVEKYRLQHESSPAFTVDNFLDRSRTPEPNRCSEDVFEFGTRREHKGEYTLRNYLEDKKILQQFLSVV